MNSNYEGNALLMNDNCVNPMTTNAYVSSSTNIANVLNANNNPMYNLGLIRYEHQSLSDQTSDMLIAINLPSKYDSSYVLFRPETLEKNLFFFQILWPFQNIRTLRNLSSISILFYEYFLSYL